MQVNSRRIASCAVTAALGVVLMLLGSFLGLGMYMAPMFVGWCLMPLGKKYGRKYQILLWIAIGILCLILVSDIEQNLMFAGFFGWYPIVRPKLQCLAPFLRIIAKLVIFNTVIVALESLVLLFLVPEALEVWMAVVLLVLGNLMFLFYDFAFPAFERLSEYYFKKFLP